MKCQSPYLLKKNSETLSFFVVSALKTFMAGATGYQLLNQLLCGWDVG